MIERAIRALKEQCVELTCPQQHATRVILDWIQLSHHRLPHQALGMNTPRRSLCLNGLSCAETAGSLQLGRLSIKAHFRKLSMQLAVENCLHRLVVQSEHAGIDPIHACWVHS